MRTANDRLDASKADLAEGRISAASSYLQRCHESISKVFTDPLLIQEDDATALELLKEMWVQFAQGQLEVLGGEGAGRDLEKCVSEEGGAKARLVAWEQMEAQDEGPFAMEEDGKGGAAAWSRQGECSESAPFGIFRAVGADLSPLDTLRLECRIVKALRSLSTGGPRRAWAR